ncbi:hypothetical protein J437_LFUL016672 [Ladona fulva]|uniref:PiggyBac transposable element-derived protein domain-containing protein n=1 Tax=Ladona fulva TaxID=123851 RepID=A0A8K0KNV2_LADFU|nr:hypothetical protein J437_LFUL016672 [Ladona fulva]
MDNRYTSYLLAQELLARKATVVGMIRKNKRENPTSYSNSKAKDINSTLFGAVDTIDQLCINYNVARNCRHWPLVIFYSFMNVLGINAQIVLLFTENPPTIYKSRWLFLKDLAIALVQPIINIQAKLKKFPLILHLHMASSSKGEELKKKLMKKFFIFWRKVTRKVLPQSIWMIYTSTSDSESDEEAGLLKEEEEETNQSRYPYIWSLKEEVHEKFIFSGNPGMKVEMEKDDILKR